MKQWQFWGLCILINAAPRLGEGASTVFGFIFFALFFLAASTGDSKS